MSVVADFRVDIRPYSAYDDPGLPVASWIAEAGSVGDASGGIVRQDYLFHRDDGNQVSELFSIEQMAVDTTRVATVDVILATESMDSLAANRPATNQKWTFQCINVGVLGGNVADFEGNNLLPLWLGAPNRVEGDSGISFTFINVDLILYFTSVQGYMWGPRAMMAPGGPRRPVGGLYGRS